MKTTKLSLLFPPHADRCTQGSISLLADRLIEKIIGLSQTLVQVQDITIALTGMIATSSAEGQVALNVHGGTLPVWLSVGIHAIIDWDKQNSTLCGSTPHQRNNQTDFLLLVVTTWRNM